MVKYLSDQSVKVTSLRHVLCSTCDNHELSYCYKLLYKLRTIFVTSL